ncbi:MAG: FKBP-type peptidyl-prolyl cis-trans isomerase [Dissulfurimicrobium sp.]|uniref:FKBP-type peptidyl-prolyl cis-trans isomerase n=1 Tax=Dissulfurimicrobium TaxID=1769732 RepID=UPI001EDAFBB5|nr:FKBP-type peptidyl-prolyl cis-trans isomerase [Dissulfurimicrobium hydrothermale]UKL12899.1 FKBP-type peptidyl-prolyl cis-trans isomerase [Dissulfurimicrobium hydrothermale]
MKIEENTVVQINYSLSLRNGELPERLKRPFTAKFIYGRERIPAALESALAGHEEGDEFEVTIPHEQAYGPYNPDLVSEIDISNINHPEKLREGAYYEETGHDGKRFGFTVKEIRKDSVIADFNHPAAGKDMMMKVTVTEARPASYMELIAAMGPSMPKGKG